MPCRAAIAHAVRACKWDDAVRLLARFAGFSEKMEARNSEAKAHLSAIVVRLHAAQAGEAWAAYQAALGSAAFAAADEALAAEELLAGYRAGSAEAVAAAVQAHATFMHLDNQARRIGLVWS